jgi:hypothetical protein
MRTKCVGLTLWLGAGVLLGWSVGSSRAQSGPEGGAVLRSPFDDPAPGPASPVRMASTDSRQGSASFDQILAQISVDPRYALNRDLEPEPKLGPWMICIHSYVAKEAPEMARQMAAELRTTYRLPAFVFTYGLEERRQEFERVKAQLDQQREFLKDKDLQIIYTPRSKEGAATPILSNDLPLEYAMSLLKVKHIQVQCAVLVGGYASQDAAHRALLPIQKLPQPDPNKVKLDVRFYGSEDPMDVNKLKLKSGAAEYVNPFKKAFVCRNPSIKQERPADQQDHMDINVLRKLNADESYTLLHCRKPITLAIKQFQTFSTVASKDDAPSILEKFGFKTRNGDGVDQAAHDAHNLAELLRKNKLEAYVLHTKFSSIVTVGGYESLEDPNLRAMQSTLESKLRSPELSRLMFFPRPMPMKVPR